MKVRKAVITAAARHQRKLPLQTIVDGDGTRRSVLEMIVGEVARAGIPSVCVVTAPGDQQAFADVCESLPVELHFVEQREPLGYGHAVLCAREFTGSEPFLHLVGDHVYVSGADDGCAGRLVRTAEAMQCAVSAVQVTRENLLPYFGTIGGQRSPEDPDLYQVETVLEKPTPTAAEAQLQIPGLRSGQYLCFFGMHVLTSTVMELLAEELSAGEAAPVPLSAALARLPQVGRYMALEISGAQRFDVGQRYGPFIAQLAIALQGADRELVLSQMFEVAAAGGLRSVPGEQR